MVLVLRPRNLRGSVNWGTARNLTARPVLQWTLAVGLDLQWMLVGSVRR